MNIMTTEILIWLIGGAVLMVLELLMPGMIIVFFGVAALAVGLLLYAGFISGVVNSLIAWFILSLLCVVIFRRLALRFFPSESSYQLVEDDVSAAGTEVDVLKEVQVDSSEGRISYNGTSWPAVSREGAIAAGRKARLLYRDNISWVVEAVDENNS